MKNPKRTFLIGFIVGLLFFGWWFRGFLYINWRFGLFSWDSWRFLFREIGSGWHLSSKSDWIFLISFILSFPLYFGLWYWINKIQWESLFKKRKSTKKIHSQPIPQTTEKKPKVQKTPPITAQRPLAMPSFGPTMRTKPIQKGPGFSSDTSTPTQFQPDYSMGLTEHGHESPAPTPEMTQSWESLEPDLRQMADTPISDIQLPQNQSVEEDINAILDQAHWTYLPNINIEDQKVQLAVCQGKIALISFDDEPGDWLADEEAFNDEDPLWFSETDHRVSPVFNLGICTKKLIQKLSDISFKVQPILVERKGNLINAEDMLKTWNDLGVIVCRTATGGPVPLKTLSEVFNQSATPVQDVDLEKIKQILS